jgi:hypothetical protein
MRQIVFGQVRRLGEELYRISSGHYSSAVGKRATQEVENVLKRFGMMS